MPRADRRAGRPLWRRAAVTMATDVDTHRPRDDSVSPPAAAPRRRKRRWIIVAAVIASGLIVAGWLAFTGGADAADTGPDQPTLRTTTSVERRDLSTTTSYDGTLSYRDPRTITATAQGTITWLPDPGAVIRQGEPLYEVDNEPVLLLRGTTPAWRDLADGMAAGRDVRQLEQSLDDLGYAEDHGVTVDREFTWFTASAVAALRDDVGLDEGFGLTRAEVQFVPHTVRVAAVPAALGQQAGGPVLETTSRQRVAAFALDAADQGTVAVDDEVSVELPDGRVMPATVTDMAGTVRSAGGSGDDPESTSVIDVEATLDDSDVGVDEAPVAVEISQQIATDVLAVPVEALLTLAEGGYALEVGGGGQTTSLLAVDVGAFADGWVEISGDGVEEGLEVISA